MIVPIVNYKSIKIAGNELFAETNIELFSEVTVSTNPPFNKIDITLIPTNCSLNHYEVRVTSEDEEYDIGVGNLAYFTTNVEANKEHTFSINITTDLFNKGNITYRVSLYAQSAIDRSWDVYYLLFTLSGEQIVLETENGEALGVLTTREAPKN